VIIGHVLPRNQHNILAISGSESCRSILLV
jgi:hypothetical protein